jgi:hypothetical protein
MIYKVKKGKHRFSPLNFKPFYKTKLKAEIKFDKSCLYDLNNQDQLDINKLFGFSKGHHHWNSYRFGWRCVENKIELLAYIYVNGKRINEWEQDIHLTFLDVDKTYKLSLKSSHNKCYFKVLDEFDQLVIIREYPVLSRFKLGYILNPYFGGTSKAPHDMEISIDYK